MIPEDKIQRAHDILAAIRLGEVPSPYGDDEDEINNKMLYAALDVLCWVLGHDHNTSFAGNLDFIDKEISKRGFKLTRRQP